MVLGYRMEAITILGKDVMQPRGLVGMGKDSLDYCGTEITDVRVPHSLLQRFSS